MSRPKILVKIAINEFERFFNFKNIKITRCAYEPETDSILLGIYTDKLPSDEFASVIPVGNFEVHCDEYGNTRITKLLFDKVSIDV